MMRSLANSEYDSTAATKCPSCLHVRLQLIQFLVNLFQLQNVTLVSSDLQTRVADSKDQSEEFFNNTLARDANLRGKLFGFFVNRNSIFQWSYYLP